MKPLTIADKELMVLALQDEIRRNGESRYDHRLHAVLLVAQGMTCPAAAALLGDSPRAVINWVQRFESTGLVGLLDGEHSGRPKRLGSEQLTKIEEALRKRPLDYGITANLWDGPTLSLFIKEQFSIVLKVRQCQRLFRQLEFRLRKPRPQVAKADPILQLSHKKTS